MAEPAASTAANLRRAARRRSSCPACERLPSASWLGADAAAGVQLLSRAPASAAEVVAMAHAPVWRVVHLVTVRKKSLFIAQSNDPRANCVLTSEQGVPKSSELSRVRLPSLDDLWISLESGESRSSSLRYDERKGQAQQASFMACPWVGTSLIGGASGATAGRPSNAQPQICMLPEDQSAASLSEHQLSGPAAMHWRFDAQHAQATVMPGCPPCPRLPTMPALCYTFIHPSPLHSTVLASSLCPTHQCMQHAPAIAPMQAAAATAAAPVQSVGPCYTAALRQSRRRARRRRVLPPTPPR